MDVHKASFSLCAIAKDTGEVLRETKCASEPKMVEKFVDRLADKLDPETTFIAGYEAGCLGYALCKSLQALGINCIIMAPTTMFSSEKNKMVKNDKMDAKMIARNLLANTYRAVHVPDDEDDDIKEYIRMRKAQKKAATRTKQQLGALILRHGFQYQDTKTQWTQAHIKWIKSLKLSETLQLVVDEYLIQLEELTDKIARYDETIANYSHLDRYGQPVGNLCCLKGMSITNAMTIHVEISDFKRFPNAPAFMSYAGLNPSEHSSGEHINKGSITKQGNSVVRTSLVEAAQSLVKGRVGYKCKAVKDRQSGHDSHVISYADRATIHLQRTFHRLYDSGKPYNVAITAVARQLAGYIWGMETKHVS
jgi:transposase